MNDNRFETLIRDWLRPIVIGKGTVIGLGRPEIVPLKREG